MFGNHHPYRGYHGGFLGIVFATPPKFNSQFAEKWWDWKTSKGFRFLGETVTFQGLLLLNFRGVEFQFAGALVGIIIDDWCWLAKSSGDRLGYVCHKSHIYLRSNPFINEPSVSNVCSFGVFSREQGGKMIHLEDPRISSPFDSDQME